jgi:DNA-binding PadR family transcriptional regulator
MPNDTHLPLAPRDLLILAVLAEGPLHGYGIIKAVEARSESGVLLDPANLYRVLRRMGRLEWIREVPDLDADEAQASPRRRTYEVTSRGRALLAAELARLQRLLRQVRPAVGRGT